jgi:hypothetical protein
VKSTKSASELWTELAALKAKFKRISPGAKARIKYMITALEYKLAEARTREGEQQTRARVQRLRQRRK